MWVKFKGRVNLKVRSNEGWGKSKGEIISMWSIIGYGQIKYGVNSRWGIIGMGILGEPL